ncbi:MAG: hypothetical protein HUU50_04815 [Candidatus Brocadiae bacterium]|nr:hypothetical protein [Candidatus Brocadiia bacterium]
MLGRLKSSITTIFVVGIIASIAYVGVWQWMVCRQYVAPGQIMYLNAKIGEENPRPEQDRVVEEGTKGIQKKIYGEGRYFINPIVNEFSIPYSYEMDSVIDPMEVGTVESFSGENPAKGEFLVSPDKSQKGIILDPLTPGVWRLNPKAYKINKSKATQIKPGFVGCITSLAGKNPPEGRLAREGERGVMENVLQPGIYYINPSAYSVEAVEVGYTQIDFKDINFSSKEGFKIVVDISVVWGLLPDKVPYIISRFGNIGDVITKIIRPQVESLCRIEGSKYGAVELVEGTSREVFQNTFTQKLVDICEENGIVALLGLVRRIEVPEEILAPIQQAKIATEETNTKKELQVTQTVINQLARLEQEVVKGVQEVRATTEKEVATILAEGKKQVANINAERQIEVAVLQKQVADIEAETTRIIGTAKAKSKELEQRAMADRLVQEIRAMGGPDEYTVYNFAQNLPKDLKIFIRHTGEGTLWTDLPKEMKDAEKLAAFKILQQKKAQEQPVKQRESQPIEE